MFLTLGIVNIILLVLSAIAKSECDTIKFKSEKAWSQSDFWLEKKDISKRSWWFKYPLSFAWGGWHLMDSTRNVMLVLVSIMPFVLYFSISWYFVGGLIVGLYIFYGLIFELFYIN